MADAAEEHDAGAGVFEDEDVADDEVEAVDQDDDAASELEEVDQALGTPNREEQLERSPMPAGDAAYTFTGIMRELESTGNPMAEQPARMALRLYPVQLQSLAWTLAQEASALRGGLLGDEMGFGKTVILAALVLSDDRAQPLGPTLVVVKKVLLEQWRRELAKAQPNSTLLRVKLHAEGWDHTHTDVVLTTFELVRREFGPLKRQSWRRVVVDESAQHLRTLSSKVGHNLGQLHTTYRWILSGTAVDGKLSALAGQLAFLGISGEAARPEWWAQVQADLSPGTHRPVRDAALRRAIRALSGVMSRHTHAQRFTLSGAPLIPLPHKGTVFVAVPFQRAPGNRPGHLEVVYRALEHLARRELKVGQGHPHSLLSELPAGRVQELLLASTHAFTVEGGEVAARLPLLQISKADTLTAGSLLPTRLVTLDLVLAGVSSNVQRRAVLAGTRCSMPECSKLFVPPGASSPDARVIVNGCSHSFCKRCISDLLLDRGADYQEIFCRHKDCPNRLQLGFLREVVSDAEYDASERALDADAAWCALDKSRPPPRALEQLRVSVCDSSCCEARTATLGSYAGKAKCSDGHCEVRLLSKQLAPQPLAKFDVVLQGSLDGVGEAARELYHATGSLQCSICWDETKESELAKLPCGHSCFCQPCLEQLYNRNPSATRCPTCRAVHTAEPLRFCDASCARKAFELRVVPLESDMAAGGTCDGCTEPLPACLGSRKRKLTDAVVYRCHWPRQASGGVGGNGSAHLASMRFHSKACAEKWFAASLQPLDEGFNGNRSLYQPGENQRSNFDELTPLTRRIGGVWYRLGYEHASTEKGSLKRSTEEWVDHIINFPGMQPHAFSAHLDAAAGSWTNPAQIPLAPKIAALLERVAAQEDDDKFLVFSQSKQLLELVEDAFSRDVARFVDDVGQRVIVRRKQHPTCGFRGTVKELFEVRITDGDSGDEWDETHVVVGFDEEEDLDDVELRLHPDPEVAPVPFVAWAKEGEDAMRLFRDEPTCCGLLLEAGNFAAGLTLTTANTVFVLEPQLDAAVQAQLEARINRPGQTRDVTIVHLYTPGTVDEIFVRRMPEFAAELVVNA